MSCQTVGLSVSLLCLTGCVASPSATAGTQGAELSKEGAAIFAQLDALATSNLPFEVAYANDEERYLFSMDLIGLPDEFFGYSNGIRQVSPELPTSLIEIANRYRNLAIPAIRVEEPEIELRLISLDHSGSHSVVTVGVYNRQPVAIIRRYHNGNEMGKTAQLSYARSAALASDLGIGPRMHGVTHRDCGDRGVVVDLVRGDAPDVVLDKMTGDAIFELIEIEQRLQRYNISVNDDFQPFTDGIHMLSIDNEPSRFLHRVMRAASGKPVKRLASGFYIMNVVRPLIDNKLFAKVDEIKRIVATAYPEPQARVILETIEYNLH